MRSTLTIDDEVYAAVMHISAVSGERPGQVLSRLARQALFGETPKPVKSSRFPVFQVPPNTPTISAAKIQQIIDEEGLI